jgi:hypothetical protein
MTSLTISDGGSRRASPPSERRRYQHQVATLLETVTQGVEKLERLRARGLRGRALAEHEAELSAARRELAAVVDSRERKTAPTLNSEHLRTRPAASPSRPKPTWAPVTQ